MMDKKRKRLEKLERRPINMDSFYEECSSIGLSAMDSPHDPKPSIKIRNNVVVEMDGKKIEEFDSLEHYISKYAININLAERAMEIPATDIAKMIVDVNVSRLDVIEITTAITPGKMLQVLKLLSSVEVMMGQMKMRRRERPANQAIVTNILDNPALLAADAADAAARGFAELETTCAVSRYAPLNAMAIMVGGLSVRPGILTQCSMEESLELKMGMRGITSYAETISFYGTEQAMDDGGDTIWSKGFLTSAYASRGIKMRCTSGTGAEVLLGHAEKKSMLYLELICIYMAKACGVQGVQNGSISCIGVTSSVPKGFLAMATENLAVSLLDMEVASGNDQTFTHSDIRRTAKLLMQMLPGTDFITSGYSAVPNYDDVFAGSNTDCDDYDDYYMFQRDMEVDGGIEPITESTSIRVRKKGAKALQGVFCELGLPPITDEEVEAAIYAYSNEEMPHRDVRKDLEGAKSFFEKKYTAIDIVKGLHQKGFEDVAANVLFTLRERIGGDYLQTSAIFDDELKVFSGLNNPNKYSGPGTGYRISKQRWEKLKSKASAIRPENILEIQRKSVGMYGLYKMHKVDCVDISKVDVVIGISPGFGNYRQGLDVCKCHHKILSKIIKGISSYGLTCQVIKINHTKDLIEIATLSSQYSKRKVSLAIQVNGRVCIYDDKEKDASPVKGFFNMSLSKDYTKVGAATAKVALNIEENERAEEFDITEYQLRMLRLVPREDEFIERKKEIEVLKLDR